MVQVRRDPDAGLLMYGKDFGMALISAICLG
jgi:hypothetical protein